MDTILTDYPIIIEVQVLLDILIIEVLLDMPL